MLRDPCAVALDTYYSVPIDLAYRNPTMLHQRHLTPGFSAVLIAIAVGVLFALGGCSAVPAGDPRTAALNVIESPIRTDQDRRMDAARHPRRVPSVHAGETRHAGARRFGRCGLYVAAAGARRGSDGQGVGAAGSSRARR